MKDLFVLTADADSEAMIRAILLRHRALQIRAISFDVRRFAGRDSGMVKEGPEIARMMVRKSEYSHLILVWDHHGSGWERMDPEKARERVQGRLDGSTWRDHSSAIIAVPELEEWLWTCPDALAAHLGVNRADFDTSLQTLAKKLGTPLERCRIESPKELFNTVLYRRKRRGPLPEDFSRIGSSTDIEAMLTSKAFARFVGALRTWFP